MSLMVPRSSSGMSRQRINFKFRSTADSASLTGNRVSLVYTDIQTHRHTHLAGSMVRLRLTNRGAILFCSFTSHPTTFGTPTNTNTTSSNKCHVTTACTALHDKQSQLRSASTDVVHLLWESKAE